MTEYELNILFEANFPNLYLWHPPKAKFCSQDIFGIFDYVSMNRAGQVSFWQITTIEHKSHRERKMLDFCNKHLDFIPANFMLACYDRFKQQWAIFPLRYLSEHKKYG